MKPYTNLAEVKKELSNTRIKLRIFQALTGLLFGIALGAVVGLNEAYDRLHEAETTVLIQKETIAITMAKLIKAEQKAKYEKEWRNKLCHKGEPNGYNLPPMERLK